MDVLHRLIIMGSISAPATLTNMKSVYKNNTWEKSLDMAADVVIFSVFEATLCGGLFSADDIIVNAFYGMLLGNFFRVFLCFRAHSTYTETWAHLVCRSPYQCSSRAYNFCLVMLLIYWSHSFHKPRNVNLELYFGGFMLLFLLTWPLET